MTLQAARRRAFWVISRLGHRLYRRFPVFGTLRASVAVIEQNGRVLAIRRNDGRGFSFPGGLAMPWESESETLEREVAEETGLRITACERMLQYHSAADIPCNISVFRVSATGQLRESWEGQPEWVAISDLRSGIIASQSAIVEKMHGSEACPL